MKVTEKIKNANKPLFSMEILPPKKGENICNLFNTIESLSHHDPAFINVTYHREEHIYREVENGLLKKHTVRKRPGTVGICAAIKNKFNIEPVPHIICGGFNKEETENALIDLNFLGVKNLIALRGDPIKSEGIFKPEVNGHSYASELIEQIVNLNKGIYLDPELDNSSPSDFCIGTAGYPEKHFESPNHENDMRFLKQKVDQGAEYIITQLFYDNEYYFRFVERCHEVGITVPIIPGIKTITSARQLSIIPHFFHVTVPKTLSSKIENAKTNQELKNVGIDWTIAQCQELIDYGVPALHFYTMGKAESVKIITEEVF
ncbi:MAG: methylenetetrahydrofolate reductase [NAD(P)H] [Flavobacteriales bacterium]